jgi:hypothetical protein
MDSEPSAELMAFAADPWLWIASAALFFGLALGQALRALPPPRSRTQAAARRRSRRIARAVAYLSISLLCAACILILPSKKTLDSMLVSMDSLVFYTTLVLGAGTLAGLFPLAGGLSLLAIATILGIMIRTALRDWTVYTGPETVARILAYEVGTSAFRGELEVKGPGAAAGTRFVAMNSNSASICVEKLEFSGPLALPARLLGPGSAEGAYAPLRRFYRVAALVSADAPPVLLEPPSDLVWIDRLLPLPDNAGFEPGADPVRAGTFGGLLVRFRSAGPAVRLSALQSQYFSLDEDGPLRLEAGTKPDTKW